jgi:hypothetical protein
VQSKRQRPKKRQAAGEFTHVPIPVRSDSGTLSV